LSKTLCGFLFLLLTPVAMIAQDLGGKDIFPSFSKSIKYPALTPDGNYLIFIAEEGSNGVAYESFRQDGKWSDPKPFAFVNQLIGETNAEVGGFSFNHDGMELYFHAKIQSSYFSIFRSRKTKAGWGAPQQVKLPAPADADYFSPAISCNNRTLFVLKTKPVKKPGDACKELLMFEKNQSAEWTPMYLPNEFNIGCQETPFFCADNNVLYFASKREGVLDKSGKKVSDEDYNIYYAYRIDINNWFYPVYVDELSADRNNLSPTLNSAGDLLLYVARKKSSAPQKIYATSPPAGKEPTKTFVISGAITDLYSKEPLEAGIVVQDAVTSVTKGVYQTSDEGRFSIILSRGSFYKVDFSRENYSHTFYYKDLTQNVERWAENMDVTLFDNVNLELNVYDNELFYPVSPQVKVTEAIANQIIAKPPVNLMKGKYMINLPIGKLYKIKLESDRFNPFTTEFDLRTDVIYSLFEKSVELEAARRQITLNVKNRQEESVLPVNVEIVNTRLNEDASVLLSNNSDGKPVLSLRTYDTYELNVSKKGYTYFNTSLSFTEIGSETIDIILDELTTQTKMVFNNITFETNSAELNAESFAELARIITLMKDNSDIKIEISAHTDDVGSLEYNARLSDKRAASAVNYLIDNGIDKARLRAKGYGKLQPLVPNTSDENRAKNRRVEIKIVD
jgi:outer membrane protein OmpA-like peptidoglycan-associated protein